MRKPFDWREVEVEVPACNVAYVHFVPPPGERVVGFDIVPDFLLVESINVSNMEQVAHGQPPMPAKMLRGCGLDIPWGPIRLRLRNNEGRRVAAVVRAR